MLLCGEHRDVEIVGAFTSSAKAFDYVAQHNVDLAILDIEMPGTSGIELGSRIKKLVPDMALIYTTGYEQYALEAYKLDAIAYLLKPCDKTRLKTALETARILTSQRNRQIELRTFGRFDVFVDGSAVYFSNAKAKELLALLVDRRGGIVTMEQAIDVLWRQKLYDNRVKSAYRTAIADLKKTLKLTGAEKILAVNRASSSVNTSEFSCDLYDLLNGVDGAEKEFNGEYMFDYSWSEGMLAYIENKIVQQ